MPHDVRALLWDMLDASEFILEDVEGITFEEYLSNRRLRQSVERGFMTIGEAARRLESVDPQTARQITGLRKIVDFRNVVVHDYDEISQPRLWNIIKVFLPPLRDEVRELYESR
jgi:uncharacterized protein with HEPN domain